MNIETIRAHAPWRCAPGRATSATIIAPAALMAMLAMLAITSRPAMADHPLLDEAPVNADWYAPAAAREATYIGKGKTTPPQIVLKRAPVRAGRLVIEIVTDAPTCLINAGDEQITVPLLVKSTNKLSLSGDALKPRLLLNDQEPADLRGPWIRLFLKTEGDNFTLVLPNATFANLKFDTGQPNAAVNVVTSPAPGAASLDTAAPGQPVTVQIKEAQPGQPQTVQVTEPLPGAAQSNQVPAGAPTKLNPDATSPYGVHQQLLTPAPPDQMFNNDTVWKPFFNIGIDWTSAYFFRGIGQENQNVIVQPHFGTRINVMQQDVLPWVDGIDLFVDIRSSHHFGPSGHQPNRNPARLYGAKEKFYELDFMGGIAMHMFDKWEFSLAYLNRIGVNNQLRDVHEIDIAARFNDKDPDYDFQLWPYALMALEFQGESDAGNLGRNMHNGVYLELGVRPEFNLGKMGSNRPVTLAVPTAVGLNVSHYYEDGMGGDDTFGYFKTGLELTLPLNTIRGDPGRQFIWNFKLGVDLLVLGNSVQNINGMAGLNHTGNDDFEVIGRVGLELQY